MHKGQDLVNFVEVYHMIPHGKETKTRIPHGKETKTINITNKSEEVSTFPAGDHKAAMNRRESMSNTNSLVYGLDFLSQKYTHR